jgi:hypothetical protein
LMKAKEEMMGERKQMMETKQVDAAEVDEE